MQSDFATVDILLVEDHAGDARLTVEAFRNRERPIRLHHVWDGQEALAFLRQGSGFSKASPPPLILLDLSMPCMNGPAALALIKSDPALKAILVIVLTSSDNEADVAACYGLGANCYLRKPPHFDGFEDLMERIDAFWFGRARLPKLMNADSVQ